MRRLELVTQIGLCVFVIGVAATASARDGSPGPDQQASATTKNRASSSVRQWDSRLRALDVNRDGRVTFAEWDADDVSFDARDWDDDGFLSGDEVVAGAVCPALPARTLPAGGEPYDITFERVDANHDDHLSKREFPGTAAMFAQLDFNRDGMLSPFEFGVGR